jgi:hypothetical protein
VRQIPADFFPIESADDLFTKLSFLRAANGDKPADLSTGGGRQTGPLPAGAGSPPRIPPGANRAGRNAPSVRPLPG